MTRPRATPGTAAVLAAAGLVPLTGCAHPTATATGPTAPGSSSSSASSTPTPANPGRTAAAATSGPTVTANPATTSSQTQDPRESLDPAAAASSTSPYPHGRTGIPAGGLPAAATRSTRNPLVVAAAALRVFYGSDTTFDTEPMDAEKRALPWLGGPFAAAVAGAHIVAAPGAVWNGWAAHRAPLEVAVARGYDDGAPPDTPTTAYQQWVVTQTPVGVTVTRPWTGTPIQTVVYTTLTRLDGRWAVTTLKEAL